MLKNWFDKVQTAPYIILYLHEINVVDEKTICNPE